MKRLILVAAMLVICTGAAYAEDFIQLPNGDFVRPYLVREVVVQESSENNYYVVVITGSLDGQQQIHHTSKQYDYPKAMQVKRFIMEKLRDAGYSVDF